MFTVFHKTLCHKDKSEGKKCPWLWCLKLRLYGIKELYISDLECPTLPAGDPGRQSAVPEGPPLLPRLPEDEPVPGVSADIPGVAKPRAGPAARPPLSALQTRRARVPGVCGSAGQGGAREQLSIQAARDTPGPPGHKHTDQLASPFLCVFKA